MQASRLGDNTLERFGGTLASIPEVIGAYLVSGDCDDLLRVMVTDTCDCERLLREKLYKIKGITSPPLQLCAAHAQKGRSATGDVGAVL